METIKRKRGRPRVNVPRNNKFTLRLSDEESYMLKRYCEITGKSQAEYLRDSMKMYFNLTENSHGSGVISGDAGGEWDFYEEGLDDYDFYG